MTRRCCLAAALFVVICQGIALTSGSGFGADKIVGARWSYTAEKDGEKLTGQFRAYKKDLFLGDKKIGSIHPKDEDESRLVFTDLPEERLNGEVIIRKIANGKKPVWQGTLKAKNGDKWEFKATLNAR